MNNEFDNNNDQSGEYTNGNTYPENGNTYQDGGNTYQDNSNTYSVNSNTYPDNSNNYSENSNTYSENSNTYPDNSNNYSENSNTYPENNNTQREESNNYGNSYTSGNFYSYNQSNGQQNTNPYTVYPIPTVSEEKPKKPKKKLKLAGAAKLTAAAIAFGLIAGATFQGYYAVSQPKTTDNNNNVVAEVTETSGSSDSIVPTSSTSSAVVTDVSDVVANVMPSIVAINSTANVTSYDFFGQAYTEQQQGSGSGIIVGQNNSDILIATNNHVIEGAETVEIVFSDGTKASGTIKGSDATADLAVISVSMKDITKDTAATIKVATLGNSDNVKAGEMAIAIGNALGYGQSVTVGYISAVNREVTINEQTMTLLQTDAAINPGNSGGALLNEKGEVIGINSVKYASTDVEGMGYAIPISTAIPMINELINRQVVSASEQGFLGIDASTAQNVTDVYAQRFNMPIGVYVNDVIASSPAAKAGLAQGDIITGLDGTTIKTIDELKNALSYKKAGQKIALTIQVKENGSYTEKTLDITLGNKQ